MKKILLYFLTFIVIQMACVQVIGMIWNTITGNSDITAMKSIVISSAYSIVTIAIFTLAKWTPFSREFMKSRPWVLIYWSIIIGLGMIIPLQFVEELLPVDMTEDILVDQFKMIFGNSWGYLAIGLLAPISEELVFRGAIQKAAIKFFNENFSAATTLTNEATTLRQNMPHWLGIIFTAVLFAIMHGNPAQMPHAFLAGLLLGWMCYRTGSIIPGVVVHWVNNTLAYVMYSMYPQTYDMTLADMFGNSAMRIALAIIFSLMLFVPAVYQFHVNTRGKQRVESRE